ncbi:MAG: homoserine dehydrogenase [Acidobacteriota bacterium]
MPTQRCWRIGFAGFGSVNRALARLLVARRRELERRHGISFRVTLISSARRGARVAPEGIDLEGALGEGWRGVGSALEAMGGAPIDILFEGTPLDPVRGEPATSHAREALRRGISVISANKGPVAFAARELIRIAHGSGAGFRFESAVADCMPVFSLVESALPIGKVTRFKGILNSTSNLVLQAVARGGSVEEAVSGARAAGVAEADPAHDLDGWDQAVKASILAAILLGREVRPAQVERTALSGLDPGWIRSETRAGRVVRLAASGGASGPIRVAALCLDPRSFLGGLKAGSLGLVLETELAGTIHVAIAGSGVEQTAYGMLADMVAIHYGRLVVPSALAEPEG